MNDLIMVMQRDKTSGNINEVIAKNFIFSLMRSHGSYFYKRKDILYKSGQVSHKITVFVSNFST